MKRMDLSNTTTDNALFGTSGTLAFMQDSYTEIVNSILINIIGSSYSTAIPYILYGCVATVGGTNTSITAGAIFFNGEVFQITAQNPINPSGGNVLVGTISTSFGYIEPDGVTAADPANYSSSAPYNTYGIRTINFSSGASGSGTFDFLSVIQIYYQPFNSNSGSIPSVFDVDFTNNKTIRFVSAEPALVDLILHTTNAVIGAETTIISNCQNIGDEFILSGFLTGHIIFKNTDTLITTATGTLFIKLKYLGNSYILCEFINPTY